MSPSHVDGKTIPEIYLKRLQLTPEGTAYSVKTNGIYQPVTWKELNSKI